MTPFFVYEKGKSENVRIQKAKGVVGMEKRKKQPLYVLLFVMVALVSAVAFACTDGKLQGTDRETPEVGEYYCVVSDGTEYTLVFSFRTSKTVVVTLYPDGTVQKITIGENEYVPAE